MMSADPSFTLGIEEEYLLVDRDTRDLAADPPPELVEDLASALGERVTVEFMRCQAEVDSPVCESLADARAEIARLRSGVAECAARYNLAPISASTHPFADWSHQRNTDKARYNQLASDLQMVVRRMVISGMHVHIGIDDEAVRFDLFNQLPYFLPHLLALSTSSPFWRGENTGLHSYRLAVWNEVPRTGLPPTFSGADEYHRTLNALIKAGEIEDGTKIWWDLRPSARFPTLEMRIADCCTRIDDAIAIAAAYRCIARMLYRLRRSNQRWRSYSTFLIAENRWLAQRYGATGNLIDFGKGEPVPFEELVEELIVLTAEDAAFFGCEAEIAHLRTIMKEGTSAVRQVRVHDQAIADGASQQEALVAVVDHLIAETMAGCAAIVGENGAPAP